jgi:glucose/arabinose dehydrogenase
MLVPLSVSKMFIPIMLILLGMLNLNSCNNPKANETGSLEKDSTSTVNNDLFKKYNLDKIILPAGFIISVYAEVDNARSMCLSPNGTLFVGNRNRDKVYAVTDDNKDGIADKVYTVATDLNTPNGVAFKDGSLYIACISTIYRLDSIELRLENPPKPVVVYNKYPVDDHHGWKFIAFGPDGKLYVPVGAPCNVCKKSNPVYSSITTINADGTGMEVFASGIRNSVGFAWHPVTKQLWFTDNGRDNLGDNVPEDELNNAPQKGMHFGFPYCHQGNTLDPEFGKGKNCTDYTAPVQTLGPHVAALGMRFYTASAFPAEYRNAIFIAQHGSWNRSAAIGYKVVVATLNENGNAAKAIPFAEGWLQADGKVLGRPVDIQVMNDGTLLVSDDFNGAIYKIAYNG